MKRNEMIKDKDYFNELIRKAKFIKDKNYVIYYKNNDDNFTHFGIAIKNAIGKANVRNKLKRQTRAIIDQNKKLFKNNRDYIIMIRDGCLNSDYKTKSESIIDLLKGIENEKK